MGGMKGLSGGLSAGAQGAAGATGIASLFNPSQEKADKMMTSQYEDKGLMGDDAFKKEDKKNQATAQAYGAQTNNLFAEKGSEVKTKNMIIYKKGQDGAAFKKRGLVQTPLPTTLDREDKGFGALMDNGAYIDKVGVNPNTGRKIINVKYQPPRAGQRRRGLISPQRAIEMAK